MEHTFDAYLDAWASDTRTPQAPFTDSDYLFPVRVDGIEAERLSLPGKPSPDVFIEAARRLGATPERTAVVEDAIAGVEAGRAGGFALVIGVDRVGRAAALRAPGADIVVRDLGERCVRRRAA